MFHVCMDYPGGMVCLGSTFKMCGSDHLGLVKVTHDD